MLIARSVHPLPGEAERKERLLSLIDGFSSRRVLVLGDLIADEFIYGEVARVSREAPVLILKYDATEIVAGGAGNAANNVATLGGRTRLVGLIGADPEGRRLLAGFHRGVVRAAVARRARRRPIPVLLDSRYRLLDYRGLTTCTPNESEVEHILGIHIDEDADALERAGRRLLRRTGMHAVLITRGSRGMALFQPRQPAIHLPIFGSDEVTDVTGAGDTVNATFGLALAAGASFYEAARLANYAGGLVVMKRGTATVSSRELADAVSSDHDTTTENWSQEGPPQGRRTER